MAVADAAGGEAGGLGAVGLVLEGDGVVGAISGAAVEDCVGVCGTAGFWWVCGVAAGDAVGAAEWACRDRDLVKLAGTAGVCGRSTGTV